MGKYLFFLLLIFYGGGSFQTLADNRIRIFTTEYSGLNPNFLFLKTDQQANQLFEYYYPTGPESVIGNWEMEKDTLYLYPHFIYDAIYDEQIVPAQVDTLETTVITIPERYLMVKDKIFLIIEDSYPDPVLEPRGTYQYINGNSPNHIKTLVGSLKLLRSKSKMVSIYRAAKSSEQNSYLLLKRNPFHSERNYYEYFSAENNITIIGLWKEENKQLLLFPQYNYYSAKSGKIILTSPEESNGFMQPIRYAQTKNGLLLTGEAPLANMPLKLKISSF